MPGMNLSNMKCIRSYDKAAEYFANNSRVSQEIGEWAPLNGVRKKHVILRRASDAFQCRLYNTDLVTYYKDGRVEVILDSRNASIEFLSRTLPDGLKASRRHGKAWLQYETRNGTEYVESSYLIVLRPDGHKWELISTPSHRKIATLQYRKIPALEKRIAPIVAWRKSVERLGGNSYAPGGFSDHPSYSQIRAAIDDTKRWGIFNNFPQSGLLEAAAEATGVLCLDVAPFSTEPLPAPSAEWRGRLPLLHSIDEIQFV